MVPISVKRYFIVSFILYYKGLLRMNNINNCSYFIYFSDNSGYCIILKQTIDVPVLPLLISIFFDITIEEVYQGYISKHLQIFYFSFG